MFLPSVIFLRQVKRSCVIQLDYEIHLNSLNKSYLFLILENL